MFRTLTELGRNFVELLYPNACLLCRAPGSASQAIRHGLCTACFRAVADDPLPSCPRCARTVGPHADLAGGCLGCRGESLGFDRAIRLGPYDGKLRDAILRTKVTAGEGTADFLGRVFAEARGAELVALGADAVVPVPLHWRRRWARGYNQAEAIGRELAGALGVPFRPRALVRVRHVVQHLQPSHAARREAIKGAFLARRRATFAGRAVLLVDDVMTTGSTAGEAARTLLAAGAGRVAVAVLARA
ncbi:MAG: double zinc ribbon domain-containing protein [Gemmataceae bacterium]|nr:double zinc ribbon domain-containing protein [Gemmataceae bacterium]